MDFPRREVEPRPGFTVAASPESPLVPALVLDAAEVFRVDR
jgi:hypothetical protein